MSEMRMILEAARDRQAPPVVGGYERVVGRAKKRERRLGSMAAVIVVGLVVSMGAGFFNAATADDVARASAAWRAPLAAAYGAAGLPVDLDLATAASRALSATPGVALWVGAMSLLMLAGFSMIVIAKDPSRAPPD